MKSLGKTMVLKCVKALWDRVAVVLLQYMFLDDPADGLKSFHFSFLNVLQRGKKVSVLTYLYVKLLSIVEEVHQGKQTDPLHQGLIIVILRHAKAKFSLDIPLIPNIEHGESSKEAVEEKLEEGSESKEANPKKRGREEHSDFTSVEKKVKFEAKMRRKSTSRRCNIKKGKVLDVVLFDDDSGGSNVKGANTMEEVFITDQEEGQRGEEVEFSKENTFVSPLSELINLLTEDYLNLRELLTFTKRYCKLAMHHLEEAEVYVADLVRWINTLRALQCSGMEKGGK